MAFQNNFNGFIQEIRRFNEETSAFINNTLHTLRNLEAIVDNKMNLIAEVKPSTASDGSESNGVTESHVRREPQMAVKRSADDADDNEIPIKKPRISNEQVEDDASRSSNEPIDDDASRSSNEDVGNDAFGAISNSNDGGRSGSPIESPKIVDDEMNGRRSVMNVKASMSKSRIIDYLNLWLARVYDRTAKFYTIKKYSRMGAFTFYVAIDVNLDETKDDIHVVINSVHVHRPDVIFRFFENCFQDRKVVSLLHIVTNDESHLREDPVWLEKIIREIVEPIVVHL